MYFNGLRRNNLKLFEEASELELKIELYKKLDLDCKKEEKKLNELYNKIKEVKYNGNE